jgi:nicotinate-nucleotide adenylyltransferase
MNIALFGGTFDPIHRGHVAIARAARQRFDLGMVYFIPADVPPHKQKTPISSFEHRYAMVALATAGEKAFVPSLLEAPPRYQNVLPFRDDAEKREREERAGAGPSYSIDTVRRVKQTLAKSAQLYFLIGIDAFLEISTWREPEALLREVEFIVASRPGFSLADVAEALPERLRPRESGIKPFKKQPARGSLVLPGVTLHLLDGVNERVSATQIRQAVKGKRSLGKLVPDGVAEYIKKQGLYAAAKAHHEGTKPRRKR